MQTVITDGAQLTPEWLTRKLYDAGALPQGEVLSIQVLDRKPQVSTWFAEISSFAVIYSDKTPVSAPKRLLLKRSKPNLKSDDFLYGRKEVGFYNHIAKVMDDPPLVRCFDASFDPDTGRSHILLEDLSATHFQPQPPLQPSQQNTELAMESLANIHAHWWEHPRLGKDIRELSITETTQPENLGMPHTRRETEELYPHFVDFLGDQLPVAWCRFYEKVFSMWPFSRLSKRLNARQGITLIHRDAHTWNFLYPRNPEQDRVFIIDWHEWDVGLGADDLTEMLILWWDPARRFLLEEALVRRYYHQLIAQGVDSYAWEQCWNDYRLAAIRILLYPIWMCAEGRPPTFWQPILERSILAFQDLKCVDLLE